jgi:hypothetical protein
MPDQIAVLIVETGIPAPYLDALAGIQWRLLVDPGTKAGRTDRGAVATGQATFGNRLPEMFIITSPVQGLAQIPGRQCPLLHAGPFSQRLAAPLVPAGQWPGRQPDQQRPAPRTAGLNHKALIQFIEHQIRPHADLGAIPGRNAEAGRGTAVAVDANQQQLLTAGLVMGIGIFALQKMPVLQRQRRQITATQAYHRRQWHLLAHFFKPQATLDFPGDHQRLLRSE